MAKRSRPVIPVTWFLREWMDALHVRQSEMCKRAGWSKTTASLLYNCQQDMNVDLLKDAANALNLEMFELLLPPERAMHIRRIMAELRIVAQNEVLQLETPADNSDTKKAAAS